MADNRLTRFYHKIFANNALTTPTGVTGVFGSGKSDGSVTGGPQYTADLLSIQGLGAWAQGWEGAINNLTKTPAMQDMNSVFFALSYQIAYLLQAGIPEWNASTTYHQYQFCTTSGRIYFSKQNTNLNHATSESSWWQEYGLGGPSAVKAWVNFKGDGGAGACTVNDSYNISGVNKDSTGVYTITFLTAMANGNYAWSGNVGGNDGKLPAAGDDNHICGMYKGNLTKKTATTLQVSCYDRGDGSTQDGSNISVIVFST